MKDVVATSLHQQTKQLTKTNKRQKQQRSLWTVNIYRKPADTAKILADNTNQIVVL